MSDVAHHPPGDELVGLVTGDLDLASRVVLEAHLDFCAACRAELADLAAPGSRWLAQLPELQPRPQILGAILGRLEPRAQASAGRDPWAGAPLPAGARAELPGTTRLDWRRLPLSRAKYCRLWRRDDTSLLLVRLGPDRRFPDHVHLGDERLVVLAGGYEDQRGESRPGDYQLYGPGTRHAPLSDTDETCWIVTRIHGPVRFTGWRGLLARMLGRLGRRSTPTAGRPA